MNRIKDQFQSSFSRYGSRTALRERRDGEDVVITYSELLENAQLRQATLKKLGIAGGDRVVLLSESGLEWVGAAIAVFFADATLVALDAALPPKELSELIKESEPKLLLISPKMKSRMGTDLPSGIAVVDMTSRWELLGDSPVKTAPLKLAGDPDVALVLFTSGTSGRSKGVMLSHEGLITNARGILECIGFKKSSLPERLLGILPLNHVAGFVVLFLAPLLAGYEVVFVERPDAQSILDTIRRNRITVLPAVPRLFELIYQQITKKVSGASLPAKTAFSALMNVNGLLRRGTNVNLGGLFFAKVHENFGGSLRVLCSGAAPLSWEIQVFFQRLGFSVIQAYGLTETCGPCISASRI